MTSESISVVTKAITFVALLGACSALWPVWTLWRTMRRTALRSAAAWACVAVCSWVMATGMNVLQPRDGSVELPGLARLLSAAMLLAPIVAVLGARRPGEAAWNCVVAGFLIVFTLPILEQGFLGKPIEIDRIGMDGPRMMFYSIVGLLGVVNYLPTRFLVSDLLFGVGMSLQAVAVGPWTVGSIETVNLLFAMGGIVLSVAVWSAFFQSRAAAEGGELKAWQSLQDSWGLVWSARVLARWNAAARFYGWRLLLDRRGLHAKPSDAVISHEERQAAVEHLQFLLRRFLN